VKEGIHVTQQVLSIPSDRTYITVETEQIAA